ncbi:acyl-CoA dehydrogenase family protein [Dasania marina]|uniref:acyl-CoA dehydrogenase family protein n=1 Tax=Dasania marina TaxID=471499 RepID=UPI00037D5563|nr:acyl-CoA dehydrogenase family protein [Dasania marina]
MSELRTILADTVTRLFSDISESGSSNWEQLEALGLPSLMLDEDSGGFNGQWQDAVLVARQLGYFAIPQPLIETILARFALQQAGHSEFEGPLSIAHCDTAKLQLQNSQHLLTARLRHIPWGESTPIVISGQYQQRGFVALLPAEASSQQIGSTNLAAEPQAELLLENTAMQAFYWLDQPINLYHLAALMRSAQIAGALDQLVNMSVQYSSEREQFGRPLSKFQVIQHNISQLAEQAAAVLCASESAARALDCEGSSDGALFEIAASKLRANMAIPQATSIAHQLHGAIGFTEEHRLHLFTRRLLAWRSEYGSDRFWANILGQWCLDARTDGFWSSLTARSDRQMKTPESQPS